jgi:hypothetical protein
MWALSVVVPAAPDTKAERLTSFRVEWEGKVDYTTGSRGPFPVIAWRFRPDQPDEPEPVPLLDDATLLAKDHEQEDFDQYCIKVVAEQ